MNTLAPAAGFAPAGTSYRSQPGWVQQREMGSRRTGMDMTLGDVLMALACLTLVLNTLSG